MKAVQWDRTDCKLGISDQYVVLDSFQKREDSKTERGEYVFNFNPQGVTKNQMIGVRDKITRLIEVHLERFTIPLLKPDRFKASQVVADDSSLGVLDLQDNSTPSDDAIAGTSDDPHPSIVNHPRQQYVFNRRVTMYMRDIGAQSFTGHGDTRHHFEFDTTIHGDGSKSGINGDKLLLTPHTSKYVLTDPIAHIHGLTINFFNPDRPLRIPPDVMYGAQAYSRHLSGSTDNAVNCMQFQFIDQTGLIELSYGDRVFIAGFEHISGTNAITSAPGVVPVVRDSFVTRDAILNRYINRPEGHILGDDPVGVVGVDGGGATAGPSIDATYTGLGNRWNIYLDPYVKTIGLYASNHVIGDLVNGDLIRSRTRVDIYIAKYRIRIPVRFRTMTKKFTNGITSV